jgi:hypothetical protein
VLLLFSLLLITSFRGKFTQNLRKPTPRATHLNPINRNNSKNDINLSIMGKSVKIEAKNSSITDIAVVYSRLSIKSNNNNNNNNE